MRLFEACPTLRGSWDRPRKKSLGRKSGVSLQLGWLCRVLWAKMLKNQGVPFFV